MTRVLLVAVFGAVGATSRYAIDGMVYDVWSGRFPLGTFLINVAGSFALGILVAVTTERMLLSPNWRFALGIGFLSAFTTFSTYTYDTIRLAESNQWGLALLNAFGSLAVGLLAAFVGLKVGRAI